MSRKFEAYLSPSIIFQGVALGELAGAASVMLRSKPESRRTPLFILSLVSWVVLVLIMSFDLSLLDWSISVFAAEQNFHAKRAIAAFVMNLLGIVMMLLLFMVRLRVFHKNNSPTFWLLLLVALATLGFAVPATYLGVSMNQEVLDGKIPIFFLSSRIEVRPMARFAATTIANQKLTFAGQSSNALFAATYSFVGVFSAACSIAFLWEIAKSLGFSKQGFLYEMMFKQDGARFIAILGLNAVIAGFAAHAYFHKFNYITYSAFYMPPMIYAFEVHTFLITSYVAPRKIIERKQRSDGNPRSITGLRSFSNNEALRSRLDQELEQQRKGTVNYF
ncbi:hypothetical protein HK105_207942 [Polyrhizophydium stewartii]|uniref:Uncharacterized protein n=1 Tax=Polyrhizophydium stewartii TaxID=2732419 RepID=A0ABR4MZ81_9FUNG|nr:hypothetical protein HK105_002241 [Polyrhizophydium stewartii]